MLALNDKILKTVQLIRQSKAILILAGAGMSVDSGLSQFRGDNGYWTKILNCDKKTIAIELADLEL